MNTLSKALATVLLASAIAVPVSAADLAPMETPLAAPATSGFYFGSLSSVNFLDDTGFDFGAASVSTEYDVGYYSALRAGYNFGSMGFVSPRLELELGYGSASVDEHSVSGFGGVGGIDSYGDARSFQGYVNGYLDIPLAAEGAVSAITPYVGGGAGFMNLELRKQGVSGTGTGTLMDDSDTQFAYHLDAGVGINLQAIGLFTNTSLFDNTTFDIGYRFTAADDFNFEARDGFTSSTDFRSHAVTFGLRRQF